MGWRAKFVFVLIVYFAGFATAVYCLAPAPEAGPGGSRRVARTRGALTSEGFAKSVNSGIHKCVAFGKEAAVEVAKLIREKMEEAEARSGG